MLCAHPRYVAIGDRGLRTSAVLTSWLGT